MSELKKLLIETPVDKLVDLVVRKKQVGLKEAAKFLGVEEDIVEEWTRTLEQHGYLKIVYKPMGPPFIEIGDAKIPAGPEDEIDGELYEQRSEKMEQQLAETEKKFREENHPHEKRALQKHKKILKSLIRAHSERKKSLKTGKKKSIKRHK